MTRTRLIAFVSALVMATASTAGCGNPLNEPKDENVETVAEAETLKTIEGYAQRIADVAGVQLVEYETNSAPCTGPLDETTKDIYTTLGAGQLFVPEERHAAILDELLKEWQARGYEVEIDERKPASPGDELAVYTTDRFRLRVTNTSPPTALSLLINSPCRRSPVPLF